MRRAAGFAALILMIAAAAGLILPHLRLADRSQAVYLTAARVPRTVHTRKAPALPQGTVDINRASAEELDELPGVGPVIAQRIIEEREQGGRFHYPEDLLAVDGIGAKTLEKIRTQICINK